MNSKLKITFISDTHGQHKKITNDLIGGDVLIHCGDISSRGYEHEVRSFLEWFNGLNGKATYTHKIFIAGNHDFYFERFPDRVGDLLKEYPNITYLQDSSVMIGEEWREKRFKVWGSPWQPRFYNWAFNLDRNSDEIEEKWKKIPDDADILITHGPPHGILDWVNYNSMHVGCERIGRYVDKVKPSIHCFGHIHEQNGIDVIAGTTYINASVLDGRYNYSNKPVNIELKDNGKVVIL